jgi:hypothetical protein
MAHGRQDGLPLPARRRHRRPPSPAIAVASHTATLRRRWAASTNTAPLSAGSSSAPVDRPHPCAPLSCMQLGTKVALLRLPRSTSARPRSDRVGALLELAHCDNPADAEARRPTTAPRSSMSGSTRVPWGARGPAGRRGRCAWPAPPPQRASGARRFRRRAGVRGPARRTCRCGSRGRRGRRSGDG